MKKMIFIWTEYGKIHVSNVIYFDFKISITNSDFPETSADFQLAEVFFCYISKQLVIGSEE
jgi:hypothetical protein